MEDEVEKFHKRKDKLSLTVSDDEIDEDSLDEEVGLASVQCVETWVWMQGCIYLCHWVHSAVARACDGWPSGCLGLLVQAVYDISDDEEEDSDEERLRQKTCGLALVCMCATLARVIKLCLTCALS